MTTRAQAVVIGASAGAFEALSMILPELPENYSLPIVVLVHLPPAEKSMFAPLLDGRCRVVVKEAEEKEPLAPGTVYIGPPDYHLLIERKRYFSLSSEEPVRFSRPSVDVLFETAADAFGRDLVGLVLTGANSDGARGLRAIIDAGGTAVVQNPELARASAMPLAAIELCPEARILSIEEITAFLLELAPI